MPFPAAPKSCWVRGKLGRVGAVYVPVVFPIEQVKITRSQLVLRGANAFIVMDFWSTSTPPPTGPTAAPSSGVVVLTPL